MKYIREKTNSKLTALVSFFALWLSATANANETIRSINECILYKTQLSEEFDANSKNLHTDDNQIDVKNYIEIISNIIQSEENFIIPDNFLRLNKYSLPSIYLYSIKKLKRDGRIHDDELISYHLDQFDPEYQYQIVRLLINSNFLKNYKNYSEIQKRKILTSILNDPVSVDMLIAHGVSLSSLFETDDLMPIYKCASISGNEIFSDIVSKKYFHEKNNIPMSIAWLIAAPDPHLHEYGWYNKLIKTINNDMREDALWNGRQILEKKLQNSLYEEYYQYCRYNSTDRWLCLSNYMNIAKLCDWPFTNKSDREAWIKGDNGAQCVHSNPRRNIT